MLRRPPISTRTYTPFPYTTLFRSSAGLLEGLLRDVRRPLFLTLAARDDRRLDTPSGAQIIRLTPLHEDEVRHATGSISAARDAPAPPPLHVDRIDLTRVVSGQSVSVRLDLRVFWTVKKNDSTYNKF